MNTVIRCHIKNLERLQGLERAIVSWHSKRMYELGKLYLVDDHSPMAEEVRQLADKYKAIYHKAEGRADTKNGLVESLKVQNEFPVLCCVDDFILGEGIKERFEELLKKEVSIIENECHYGTIGTFACYHNNTRDHFKIENADLWNIPTNILYALVCHLYSKELSTILINEWDLIQKSELPDPCCCDDIWVARICERENLPCFNTIVDFASHTGAANRTFGNNPADEGSNYQTPCFIGE